MSRVQDKSNRRELRMLLASEGLSSSNGAWGHVTNVVVVECTMPS